MRTVFGGKRYFIDLLCCICICFLFFHANTLDAWASERNSSTDFGQRFLAEYEGILYDARSGLQSSAANAIAQTPDGYIWVGTYSGLYRYDGVKFERFVTDSPISNVMRLFVDRDGDLWIGSNDSGVYVYHSADHTVEIYDTSNCLSADSVRSITQDAE